MSTENDPNLPAPSEEPLKTQQGQPETTPAEPKPEAKPRQRLTAEALTAEMARLDKGLVAIVMVLTFFLGSFIARNYDFWVHLATGRDIVHGTYRFSGDPYSYTVGDERPGWVNPSWLTDVAFYALAGTPDGEVPKTGGMVLVAVKAALLTLLAGVLLLIRRPSQSLWIPAVCTAVAALAMSPRFQLQPSSVSFLFLGITLCLLAAPQLGTWETRPGCWLTSGTARWLLVPLFLLWANLDGWFFLGPLTVILYLAGNLLQQRFAPAGTEETLAPAEARRLGIILVVGLAACLVNPYHVRIFMTLPAEAWALVTSSPLENTVFRDLTRSPLGGNYYTRLGGGLSVAGLSWFVLLIAGIVSFAVNSEQLRWWRVAVWLPFCVLSALLVRAVPFFALVAGPITALNFQDFAARRFGLAPRLKSPWREWSLAGRGLTLLAGVVLLLLAWPGWLHTGVVHGRFDDPNSPRRVGWGIEPDPSSLAAARALCTLRKEGVLQNGFNFTPEISSHCAWFCPEEKAFLDLRLPAYPESVVDDYLEVRRNFDRSADPSLSEPEASGPPLGWEEIFRRHQIDHVVVTKEEGDEMKFLADTASWCCLYLDGRTTVFAWLDPRRSTADLARLQDHRLDFAKSAFGPDIPVSERAPRQGREPPQVPGFLARYLSRPRTRPLAADEAQDLMTYFQYAANIWPTRVTCAYAIARAAGAAAAGGTSQPIAEVASGWAATPRRLAIFQRARDVGPVGASLLAVRAARRAVGENPASPGAQAQLGLAYKRLWADEEGPWSAQGATLLHLVRQTQIVTALQNSLTLDPDNTDTHGVLSDVYMQMNNGRPNQYTHLDLAAEELQKYVTLTHKAGPMPGERTEDFEQSLQPFEHRLEILNEELKRRREDYEVKASNRPRLVRAQIAYDHGLAGEAYQRLLEGDVTTLTEQEKTFILRLLLSMGQIRDAENLEPQKGPREHLLVAAARGDYAHADQLLEEILAQLDQISIGQLANLIRGQAFQTIVGPASLRDLNQIVQLRAERCNWLAIRGILALEAGDTIAAANHLKKAEEAAFPTTALVSLLSTAAARGPLEQLTLTANVAPGWLPEFRYENEAVVPHYLELLKANGTTPGMASRLPATPAP